MNELLKHLRKQLKRPVYSGHEVEDLERISTGLATLDIVLGGGIPKGRVIQIWGKESAGKSALCLSLIRNRQTLNPEGTYAYIDAERSIHKEDLDTHNIDKDRFVLYKPDGGEEAIDAACTALNYGAELAIIDSVPYLRPKRVLDEIKDSSEYRDVSSIANLLERVQSKIITTLDDTRGNIIFINQERPPKSMYEGASYPGGSALKFMLAISLHIKGAKKDKDKPWRLTQTIHTAKNKTFTPFQTTELLLVNRVASAESALLKAAIDIDIIKERGGGNFGINSDYADQLCFDALPKGKDNAVDFFILNRPAYDSLYRLVVKLSLNSGIYADPDYAITEETSSGTIITPLSE